MNTPLPYGLTHGDFAVLRVPRRSDAYDGEPCVAGTDGDVVTVLRDEVDSEGEVFVRMENGHGFYVDAACLFPAEPRKVIGRPVRGPRRRRDRGGVVIFTAALLLGFWAGLRLDR